MCGYCMMCGHVDVRILNTITVNADNNLQRHERGKLGRMHKPSTPNTPFINGDEVIGELYQKNMVLIPITIDPWARFGLMLQAFLTTTHHPRQKPSRTAHTNSKYHISPTQCQPHVRTRLPTTMPTRDPHIRRHPMDAICITNTTDILW